MQCRYPVSSVDVLSSLQAAGLETLRIKGTSDHPTVVSSPTTPWIWPWEDTLTPCLAPALAGPTQGATRASDTSPTTCVWGEERTALGTMEGGSGSVWAGCWERVLGGGTLMSSEVRQGAAPGRGQA